MKNLAQQNTKIIENMLWKTLKKMLFKVDLHLDEWDVTTVSFQMVRQSPKFKTLKKLSTEYDSLFNIAEAFKVRYKINPNFILFKDLFNTINPTKQKKK